MARFTIQLSFALFVTILLFVVPAAAQGYATQASTPPPEDFVGSFVVDVNEVNVFFNVRQSDKFVQGLDASEFELFEDHRRQKIRYFSSDAKEPISLAILVDSSTSQSRVLQQQQEVGRRFLEEVLLPGDEALVVGFDSRIQMQQDFTANREKLSHAMARSARGTSAQTDFLDPGKIPVFRSTALFDAIAATAKQRMRHRKGHKAMLILTDGQDMGSKTSVHSAIEAAVRSDTTCYILLVVDRRVLNSIDYKGLDNMRDLAKETGGRMIKVDGKVEHLQQSFSLVAQELRNHYTLAYTPDKKERNGEYRTIQVKSRHGYHVLARRGYYATSDKPPREEALK